MGDPNMPLPDLSSPNALSVVSKYWSELDLESMRTKLDDVGLKIAEHQEEAMQNRRKLAEVTREYKRTATEAATKGVGPLLKQYQDEIDRLTKRSKHGETAFLELYQKLYEAPDPAPVLAAAFETASRVADLEAQCRKMSHELAEYRAESAQIKNQDLTIRKLEEKVRNLEAALEAKGHEVDEVRAQAVADADAARMAQMQEREEQLTAMLAEAQASLGAMQKLHTATQNQLFAIQSQSEEERVGRQTELELASSELERAQERLMALEREKHQLKAQLDKGPADGQSASHGGALPHALNVEESMRQELHTQREVAARLRLEVTSLRRELEQANSMWEARVEGMRSTLQAAEQHSHALEQELANRPTASQVEELRSQIRLLQAVGYNTLGDEDGDAHLTPRSGGGSSHGSGGGDGGARTSHGAGTSGRMAPLGQVGSLEAMLLQKNRHLEHELTMVRLKVVDGQAAVERLSSQVAELEVQLAERAALVERLEEDLLSSRSAGVKGGQGQGKGSSKGRLSGLLGDDGGADAEAEVEEEQAESSMVRVVCSQRDRFRAKVVELEEELTRVRGELSASKSAAAAAQADNVALVERLRYVHGFKAQQRGAGDVEVGADAERRYGRMYDDGINPFKEFQGQQRERQRTNLHVADKMMYMFGQLVFGSQGARLGTFLYLVVLHLLVVGTLMRLTHQSSNQLFEHQQDILDDGRHDVTALMHHEDTDGVAADARLP